MSAPCSRPRAFKGTHRGPAHPTSAETRTRASPSGHQEEAAHLPSPSGQPEEVVWAGRGCPEEGRPLPPKVLV